MFDITSLSTSTENPTFLTILLTVLCAFLLSVLIAFTYEKTSRQVARPDNFIQSLVLIAIVAATVMQAIGDSLARGLGMLGVLSIIRFRTTLRNPRNIVFIFSSLAAGIACGVFGYIIAFTGTLFFCFTAFVLRATPFSQRQNLVGTLTLEIDREADVMEQVLKIIKMYSRQYSKKGYRTFNSERKQQLIEHTFLVKMQNDEDGLKLSEQTKLIPGIQTVKLEFRDTLDTI